MIITKVNEKLSIMAQPATDEFQSFADQGFTGLINVRPDGEDEEQPGSEQEAAAAKKARMSYTFIPVTLPTVTESEVAAFQEALDEAEGPVVAHCKSGTRALHLYAIGEVLAGRMRRSEVQEFGHLHGFDLTEATAWLENHFAQRPNVRGFFDERTCSIQYVVSDPETGSCAIIDPVLDYDEKAGAIGAMNANAILQYVNENALSVEWILDTHPHADHFSAAYYLAGQTGAPPPSAIGSSRFRKSGELFMSGRTCLPTDRIGTGCLRTAKPSMSARSMRGSFIRQVTPQPPSPMSLVMPFLFTTPF